MEKLTDKVLNFSSNFLSEEKKTSTQMKKFSLFYPMYLRPRF